MKDLSEDSKSGSDKQSKRGVQRSLNTKGGDHEIVPEQMESTEDIKEVGTIS